VLRAQFAGHQNVVYDLSWSLEDDKLLSASSDGTVAVWDTAAFSPVLLNMKIFHFTACAVFPWSKIPTPLVVDFLPFFPLFWFCLFFSLSLLQGPERVFAHPCFVYCARFRMSADAPDPRYVVTGSYDGVLRVWDLEAAAAHHSMRPVHEIQVWIGKMKNKKKSKKKQN
jgi:WD40 repeat protein